MDHVPAELAVGVHRVATHRAAIWLVVDVVSLPLPSQLFTCQGASAGSRQQRHSSRGKIADQRGGGERIRTVDFRPAKPALSR